MPQSQQVSAILEQINQEMIQLDLWQSTMPSEEALASVEPFCCDTLSFPQWLEFIFIPKMNMLIDSKLPLPQQLVILPMAEQSLTNGNCASLISLIAQLDTLFIEQT